MEAEKKNFNVNHPELMTDEMFFMNDTVPSHNFKKLFWKSKRMGNKAFCSDGRELDSKYIPIFIKVSEFEEAQRNYKINI